MLLSLQIIAILTRKEMPCVENLQIAHYVSWRNTNIPGYWCQRSVFCDCYRNMGHFLCSVERIKRFSEQLALALKNRVSPAIFHCIEYIIYYSGFLSNSRLPWKTELPRNFSLYRNIFYYSGFLSNSRLRWKTELPWNFSLDWNIFYRSGFWATRTCPEKQSCPAIFHCIDIQYTFYIQDFWATCACPEKQSCPEIFHCIEYTFYIQDFWATRACPEIFQARLVPLCKQWYGPAMNFSRTGTGPRLGGCRPLH